MVSQSNDNDGENGKHQVGRVFSADVVEEISDCEMSALQR
jgi:hypothetical protein